MHSIKYDTNGNPDNLYASGYNTDGKYYSIFVRVTISMTFRTIHMVVHIVCIVVSKIQMVIFSIFRYELLSL